MVSLSLRVFLLIWTVSLFRVQLYVVFLSSDVESLEVVEVLF